MSEWILLGDYFANEFHMPVSSGRNGRDGILEAFSPANTKQKLWSVPYYSGYIPTIIDSASMALKDWKKSSIEQRVPILFNLIKELEIKKIEFVNSLCLETGRPQWNCLAEVDSALVLMAEMIPIIVKNQKNQSEQILVNEKNKPNHNAQVFFAPVGLTLIFGSVDHPFFYTMELLTHLLLCGNCVILKPNEKNLYTTQLISQCINKAQVPSGVFSCIHGDKEISRKLIQEKNIDGVYFLGNIDYARDLSKIIGDHHSKMIYLGLGGKNASIIAPDAQIDHAIHETLAGCFYSSGQTHLSTSIVLIHETMAAEFIHRFHTLAKSIVIDHPLLYKKTPFMGPMIDAKSMEHYLTLMGMAVREGAQEIMRGKQIKPELNGFFVGPSIHLSSSSDLDTKGPYFQEEVWGPNVHFINYKEINEAITIVNSLKYGCCTSIFTKDPGIQNQCKLDLEVGIIHWNTNTLLLSGLWPRIGIKHSGNFRPGGIDFFQSCTIKKLIISPINPMDPILSDPMPGVQL